jgi:aminomethyltransferase
LSADLRRTPLWARHEQAGARLVPFEGFEMPILYTSILDEHRAVRASAGLFDVSHMGELRLRGSEAVALAQALFTNDAKSLAEGAVRYGLLFLEDGGVVDDVTLYRVGPSEFWFCVNASNVADDLAWVREVRDRTGLDCEITDESEATGLVAIQGPRALDIVARALGPDAPRPRRWRFAPGELAGAPLTLSRTGYSGEDGFEIYAPADATEAVWDALVEAGGDALTLAGLGARDTLRTEMAYPLYGHELDREIDPISAGLERFCCFGAGFVGEAALARIRDAGPARCRIGLVVEGRGVARPDCDIRAATDGDAAGAPIGRVTSGTYGPSVERSIAIGYVPPEYAPVGTPLAIEVRGRPLPARVTGTPFLESRRPTKPHRKG